MTTRSIFLFILLFITQKAFAEHTYTFRTDSIVQTLSHSHCDRVKIIDMRTDKDELGYLRTGAFNRFASIITEQPLTDLLANYYQQRVKYNTTDHKELLVLLYAIKMEDRPNGDEMGTFYFDADFYHGDGSQYQMVAHVDSIYEMKSNWDVSGKLVDRSREKVEKFLAQMSARDVTDAKTYSIEEVKAKRQTDKLEYPIYSVDSFKRGIYFTVDQFLNNTPSDTAFVTDVTYNTDTKVYSFYYLKANGKKGKKIKAENVFALYDKQWFATDRNHMEPMKFENGDFITKKSFTGVANNSSAVIMGGALFGLAGAMVASAVTDPKGMGIYKSHFDPTLKEFRPMKRVK